MSAESDIAADIARARRQPVVVGASRDVVSVSGPDARSYLQGQCSQDIEALDPGVAADALLLSPQGKVQALVRVWCRSPQSYVVDVDAGHGHAVVARLRQFRLRVAVEIDTLAWHCLAVRGPGSDRLATVPLAPGTEAALPVAWGPVGGVDLIGPAPAVGPNIPTIADEAWDVLRIEAGIPIMGADIDTQTIAAEAGLVDRAVSLTKGCYTGQELVARLDARGNKVARHLRGVLVAGRFDPAERPVGWTITGPGSTSVPGDGAQDLGSDAGADAGKRAFGTITSAAWSPERGCWVALAFVHRSVEPPATVSITSPSTGLSYQGEVRRLPLTAVS